jgi:hypothetical protein
MISEYKIQKLDEVNATLTLTMEIKHWRELREQLTTKYPSWKFGEQIMLMLREFDTHFEKYEDD